MLLLLLLMLMKIVYYYSSFVKRTVVLNGYDVVKDFVAFLVCIDIYIYIYIYECIVICIGYVDVVVFPLSSDEIGFVKKVVGCIVMMLPLQMNLLLTNSKYINS